ncbi:hypothetical protein R69746_07450 [Paraburkholderia aspalathi]|nr:hypothetical protein R69746_07450 [Paraburkholderia aspalathi]
MGLEGLKRRHSRNEADRTASPNRNSAVMDPDTLVYSSRPILPSKTIANPDSRAIFTMSISPPPTVSPIRTSAARRHQEGRISYAWAYAG